MLTKQTELAATRLAAGALGGFVMGTLLGVFERIGFPDSALFGLFCSVSGLLAGLVGHLLFATPGHSTLRSILNFAIIGSVFFSTLSLVTPDFISELMNVHGLLKSMVLGFAGGGAAGATVVIMIGGYARS